MLIRQVNLLSVTDPCSIYADNFIKYKRNMKKYVLCISISLIFLFSCFSIERIIILGRDDHWQRLYYKDNIILHSGKGGFTDLVLKEGEYKPTEETDLLIHFNKLPPEDITGSYRTESSGIILSEKLAMYGNGAGFFTKQSGGVRLLANNDALLYPGKVWEDFTVEFWLYPATMEEGETLLLWNGTLKFESTILPQEISCYIQNRRVVWNFKNFFLPPDREAFTLELRGNSPLVPKSWHHHTLRFNSSTGMLEYLLDGIPDAIIYTTNTGREEKSFYLPVTGNLSEGVLTIGEVFTGLIDELRISRSFITKPFTELYLDEKGTAITRVFDLGYTNSRLSKIEAAYSTPSDSSVYFYYKISDIMAQPDSPENNWIPFIPGRSLPEDRSGRYLQLKVELLPSGDGVHSPTVHEITIAFEPDLPPPPPVKLRAIPGDGKVILQWSAVTEQDVKGYMVYYGHRPGYYFGTESNLGSSPVDVGNKTEVTLEGLLNGRLYYFSVAAYDSADPPHLSDFSEEVSTRPSEIR